MSTTSPTQLYFTDSDEANELLATDPLALLIGFALDQQVPLQTAFAGPLKIKQRLGTLEVSRRDPADVEAAFREKPAVHRFPGSMAERVQELCAVVQDEYEGDASRLWREAGDADELRRRIEALPGFGQMKVTALGSVLAKRFGCDGTRPSAALTPNRFASTEPSAVLAKRFGVRAAE